MINNVELKDIINFNKLGLLINSNFENLFKLEYLLKSKYDYVYGYYDNNNLVAFIHVQRLFEILDVINIVVDEKYRRKGIASKLINKCVDNFNEVDSIMLEVNENNINAIELYKKNKFEVINIRKKYYGDSDAYIMKRDVKNERC